MRAFSAVPAVVAQRRCPDTMEDDCKEDSDIRLAAGRGKGSWWRDKLQNSTVARIKEIGKDLENKDIAHID